MLSRTTQNIDYPRTTAPVSGSNYWKATTQAIDQVRTTAKLES